MQKTIELTDLTHAILTEDGKERNNPKPLVIHSDLTRPLSLQDQIKRLLKTELSMQAHELGMETLEEANDFDVEDDFDTEPPSDYEQMVDEEPYLPSQPAPDEAHQTQSPEAEATQEPEPEVPPGGNETILETKPK